jgi:murein DD-endopeptidase MepM/ murein hydrolase activator NlpD
MILTACANATSVPIKRSETMPAAATSTNSAVQTITASVPTSEPEITPVVSPTHTNNLCSPLRGIPLEKIPAHITNPFHPPPPGSDDPHQGIDLAEVYPETQMALEGLPVQSVFSGKVVMATMDRFPFGFSVIIETPLNQISPSWLAQLQLPSPLASPPPISALTCPEDNPFDYRPSGARSLYVLYAHLKEKSSLQPGVEVACGDELGTIGKSGNALNPHLHFEAKVGPAGVFFSSMAHYNPSATPEEMAIYCNWAVRGTFQVVDPVKLIGIR